jgi:hypothetical protein
MYTQYRRCLMDIWFLTCTCLAWGYDTIWQCTRLVVELDYFPRFDKKYSCTIHTTERNRFFNVSVRKSSQLGYTITLPQNALGTDTSMPFNSATALHHQGKNRIIVELLNEEVMFGVDADTHGTVYPKTEKFTMLS